MAFPPAVADFKAYFVREFIYGDGNDTVRDSDITRALNEAQDGSVFPNSVWDSVAQQTTANLYLTAHLLWENINMAGGLSAIPRGRGVRDYGEGIVVSKAVGQASVNYQAPPDYVAKSASLSRLWRSTFGMRYVQMLYPRLLGNVQVVAGPSADLQDQSRNPV